MDVDLSAIVVLAAAIIGAGGIAGGIATFRKVQPEKESIIVTAAQGALVVQAGVLDDLREELARAHEQIAILQRQIGQVTDELHAEIDRVRRERDTLYLENYKLKERVQQLEAKVAHLEGSTA